MLYDLKRTLAILLILTIAYPNVKRLWIIIDFSLHQDAIAREQCINKDKPMMLCSGTCYLVKELKKETKKEKDQVPDTLEEQNEILYAFHTKAQKLAHPESFYSERDLTTLYLFRTSSDHLREVFKPPRTS